MTRDDRSPPPAAVKASGGVPRRADIKPGSRVRIVLKRDQRSGNLTEGIIQDILTRSSAHPHGIKVRLRDGRVGRVKSLVEAD